MKTGNLKLFGLLVLMVAFVLALTGCDGLRDTPDVDPDAHGLKVTVRVPESFEESSDEVGILRIEDFITVDQLEVNLSTDEAKDPDPIIVDDVNFDNGYEYTVVFDNVIAHHQYDVKVELIGSINEETGSRILYAGGATSPKVDPDALVEVDVKVEPLDGESVEVVLLEDTDDENVLDTLEKVILKHPDDNLGKDHEIIWDQDPGDSVIFNETETGFSLIPARWHLILDFGDDRSDPIEFLILPTEEKTITLTIVFERGEVKVIADVHESPEAPENLWIEDGYLKWDSVENNDFFTVLRSETGNENEVEYFEPVETVYTNEFYLVDQEDGFYWVRAYQNGYSSGIVGPVEKAGEVFVGENNFATIQEAIDNAVEGDTILVGEGTYEGNLIINVPELSLISNPGAVIDAQGADRGIEILGKMGTITIDGFKVINWIKGGIVQRRDDRENTSPQILNNEIVAPEIAQAHGNAIQVSGDGSLVRGNTVTAAHLDSEDWAATAILVEGASDVKVKENIVLGNGGDYGIVIANFWGDKLTENNLVQGNEVIGCSYGIAIQGLDGDVKKSTIKENEISETVIGLFWIDFDEADGYSESVITLGDVEGNIFENNDYQVIDYTEDQNLKTIFENNTFIPESVVFDNMILPETEVNVANTTQGIGYENLQDALTEAGDNDEIKLYNDISYIAPNEDANFSITQNNLVLDGGGYSLEYAEIGGGRSVIEATGDDVIIRDLILKNQSPDKQPHDLNAKGERVKFEGNQIIRGVEQGNPAIIVGPDATGSIVRGNFIDYGAIAADTHDCTIEDNKIDWVISEGIWMHPTPYTTQEAKERANTLASENNIEVYDAEGPVKVKDKDGNWQFADND